MNNILIVARKPETKSFFKSRIGIPFNVIDCENEEEAKELGRLSDAAIVDLSDKDLDVRSVVGSIRSGESCTPVFGYLDANFGEASAEFKTASVDNIIFKSFSKEEVRNLLAVEVKKAEATRELAFIKEKSSRGAEKAAQCSGINFSHEAVIRFFTVINRDLFDVDAFLGNFLRVFKEISRVSRAAVLVRSGQNGQYRVASSAGIEDEVLKRLTFSDREGFIRALASEQTVLKKGGADYKIEREFEILKVNYAIPMVGKSGLCGAVVFNDKIIGSPITDEELLAYYEFMSTASQVVEKAQSGRGHGIKRFFADNVIDAINSGIITVDRKGKLLDINRAACEIFGLQMESDRGVKEEDLPVEFFGMVKDIIDGGSEILTREIGLNEGKHRIEMNAYKVFDEESKVAGAAFIFEDPSYEKDIEKEARKAERFDFVNKIAVRSSHELRNCLVSIRTFTQLLPEKYVDEQFRKDFFSVVSKEVERLNSLVDKLLFFAQPVTLHYLKVNINELIDGCLAGLKAGEDNSVGINKNFSHQIPFIEVDEEQMLKAFSNIVQNAVQAMQKGGKLFITTKDEENGFLTVQFKDTGKGVVLQNTEEVFEPFFSTKSRGLGLGLTIARKIIEEHGGTIRFDSRREAGTEVTVRVPREPRKNNSSRVGNFIHLRGQ